MKTKVLKLKKFKVANLTILNDLRGGTDGSIIGDGGPAQKSRLVICPPKTNTVNTTTNPGDTEVEG